MTPDELKAARHALGLSTYDLAELLRVDPRTVRRWQGEGLPIPYAVEALLTLAIKFPAVREWLGIKP
jgi:DNA-binding transcriptional regulator YiaG